MRVEAELHLTAQPQLHSVDGVDCLQLRSNIIEIEDIKIIVINNDICLIDLIDI